MLNEEMPQGAQAPFSIDGQPVASGVITGLSWDDAVRCFYDQSHAFPVIVDATGQHIDYLDGKFTFTSGIVDERPHYQEAIADG